MNGRIYGNSSFVPLCIFPTLFLLQTPPQSLENQVFHREFCRLRILLQEYYSTFAEVLRHRRKLLMIDPFPPVFARQGRGIGLLGIAQHIGKSVFYGYV